MLLNQSKLDHEKRRQRSLTIWLVILSVSGLASFFIEFGAARWLQSWSYINVLLHSAIGVGFIVPLLVYLSIHARRTPALGKHIASLLGLALSCAFIFLWGSGLWISIAGVVETTRWLLNVHSLLAFLVIGLFVLHVVQSLWKKDKRQGRYRRESVKTLEVQQVRHVSLAVLFYFSVTCVLLLAYLFSDSYMGLSDEAAVQNYSKEYGEHRFRPSQTETPDNKFINIDAIANSRECGTCHQEIYQQWAASAHRRAASDPAYVRNINLLEEKRGITATRYCEGCHAPVALLTGQLSPGGQHGGVPDTQAFHEGVGCMGCHGIQKAVHAEGSASYAFSPQQTYLYQDSQTYLAQIIRRYLIRVKPSQHRQTLGHQTLKTAEMCATCHEQFMDQSMNDWGWVKMQSVYSDWLGSPYSHQSDQSFSTTARQRCQDCHFPLIKADDPAADHNGMVSSHLSLGANTVLPLIANDMEHLRQTEKFLRQGKVLLSIDPPDSLTQSASLQSGQFLDSSVRPAGSDNKYYYLVPGNAAHLRLSVTNRGVGHGFPAGTNDINQVWIQITVLDASLRTVFESGSMDSQDFVDKSAHFYRSIPIDRNGQEVWRHDLFRMTGVSYSNQIQPNQTDVVDYQFTVPAWAVGPLTISASLNYRKFNQRYANWVFGSEVPKIPVVEVAQDTLSITLREKPIVSQITN